AASRWPAAAVQAPRPGHLPRGVGVIGKAYLLKGDPVKVIARWRKPEGVLVRCRSCGATRLEHTGDCCGRPPEAIDRPKLRNVLIEFADGRRAVRPFRGLRRVQ